MFRFADPMLLAPSISVSRRGNHVAFQCSSTNFVSRYSGAQKFLDIVIPLLNQQFQATQLPDMQVQEHVSLLGDITLEIKVAQRVLSAFLSISICICFSQNFWIDRFHINSAAASTAAPNLVCSLLALPLSCNRCACHATQFSFSVNGVDLHMRCDWRWKQVRAVSVLIFAFLLCESVISSHFWFCYPRAEALAAHVGSRER